MKFSWGTGIVVALGLFITYILFMVATMISAHTDVVEEDYYSQQIKYQDTKEAKENGLNIEDSVQFVQTLESLNIIFPKQVNVSEITSGVAFFYRPENAELDRTVKLNTEVGNIQSIPLDLLSKGTYKIKLSWEEASIGFLIEKRITIE